MKKHNFLFIGYLITFTAVPLQAFASSCSDAVNAGNWQSALTACEQQANNGDKDAAFMMAQLFAKGVNGQPDFKTSVNWLERSTKLGHSEAAYNLAVAYQFGKGTRKDTDKAITTYQLAAKANNPKAMRNLAQMYILGDDTSQDFQQAYSLYHRAARLGQQSSQLQLAIMLLKGQGVTANPTAARYWMETAAENSYADAQFALAQLLEQTDTQTSIYWYQQASTQKHSFADHNLSLLYFEGTNVAKDLLQALAYAEKGVAQGNDQTSLLYEKILNEIQNESAHIQQDKPVDSESFKNAAWLDSQPKQRFIIQLATFKTTEALHNFLKTLEKQITVSYIEQQNQTDKRYIVFYSKDFTTQDEARLFAMNELTEKLATGTWIRSYGSLKE